jgi:hypothetical protein
MDFHVFTYIAAAEFGGNGIFMAKNVPNIAWSESSLEK